MKNFQHLFYLLLLILVCSELKSKWIEIPGYAGTANFKSVDIVDSNCFVIGGVGGLIRITYDGGNTWTDKIMEGSKTINFTKCVNDSIFICCADNGLIYRTSDKGKNWMNINSSITQNLRQISFFNTKFGVITGDTGIILISKDCGLTWKQVNSGFNDNFNWSDCIDDSSAIIAGDNGVILKTIDFGEHWIDLKVPTKNNFKRVQVLNDGRICLLGDTLCFMFSTDNGISWSNQIVENNYSSLYYKPEITGFAFFNNNDAIIRTLDMYTLTFYEYATTNGGFNWESKNLWTSLSGPDFGFGMSYMKFKSKNFGIGISQGEIHKVSIGEDGFATYKKIGDYINPDLAVIRSLNQKKIILITDNGGGDQFLFKSSDGGLLWDRILISYEYFNNGNATVEDACYFSDSLMIISMSNMTSKTIGNTTYAYYEYFLLKSSNGGNSFDMIRDTTNKYLYQPTMISENYGFVRFGYDYLTYTTDGGNTFQKLFINSDTSLSTYSYFYSTGPGSVFEQRYNSRTKNGYFQKSEDWGKTWTKSTSIFENMDDFIFLDKNNGYGYGYIYDSINGKPNYHVWINKTTDGGMSWFKTYLSDTNANSNSKFRYIKFTDKNNGMLTSYDGNSYFTSDGGSSWSMEILDLMTKDDEIRDVDYGGNGFVYAITYSSERIFKRIPDLTEVKNIDQEVTNNKFLYPNPTSDFIELPDNFINPEISIYSIIGNKVMQITTEGNRIDVSRLETGIYFIKIGGKVYKFVKV